MRKNYMRGLLLLADGFEDTEALTTRDVLTRAGIEITTASITDRLEVESSFGVHVLADALLKLIFDTTAYDFIVLPGGGRGTRNLAQSQLVPMYIQKFVEAKKLVCAICAAPSILGKLGYLKNEKYTCFTGCNEGVEGNFTGSEVEVSGQFITARSMRYSIDFALAIIERLLGKEARARVEIGLNGQTAK